MSTRRLKNLIMVMSCALLLAGAGCMSAAGNDVSGEGAALKGGNAAHAKHDAGVKDEDGDEDTDENVDETPLAGDAGVSDSDDDADEGVDESAEADEDTATDEAADEDTDADEGAAGTGDAGAGKGMGAGHKKP